MMRLPLLSIFPCMLIREIRIEVINNATWVETFAPIRLVAFREECSCSIAIFPLTKLLIHYCQEWAVYVRDFPVFLSRVHAATPRPDVRRELAENLYEEETGGVIAGRPHPELFLEYPRGLGMDLRRAKRRKTGPQQKEKDDGQAELDSDRRHGARIAMVLSYSDKN